LKNLKYNLNQMAKPVDVVIRKKSPSYKHMGVAKTEKTNNLLKKSRGESLFLDIILLIIVLSVAFMLALIIKDFVWQKKAAVTRKAASPYTPSTPDSVAQQAVNPPEDNEETTPSPSSSSSTAPRPTQTANATSTQSLKITILNGNGIRGQASQVASQLKKLGYQDIKIANASSFNFSNTIIYYKRDFKEAAEKLKEDLQKPNAELKENANLSVDLSVILGKN